MNCVCVCVCVLKMHVRCSHKGCKGTKEDKGESV